jgi:histidinol-phosphate phosphatase family protein
MTSAGVCAARLCALTADRRGQPHAHPVSAADGGSAPGTWPSRSRPGVLLDRDGTIIVDHGYVGSVDRVEFIDGAAKAIARFNREHIPVAVVTNQAGVARGYYAIDDVTRVHAYITERLAEYGAYIDLFVFCPYHPDGVVEEFACASEDRKPAPGMAKAAAVALNLDLTASWVVGDRPEDVGLAEAVGASAAYLGSGDYQRPGVWSFPSLAAAAPFILERIAV